VATTDLATILAAWPALLEAAPLSLTPTIVAFTHDAQPNDTLPDSYYLTDEGQVDRKSVTHDVEVRIDRIGVWIAKPLNFAGAAQLIALSAILDDLYRQLVVLGRAAGYNVEADTRRITHPPNTELLIASQVLRVDYDFSSATT